MNQRELKDRIKRMVPRTLLAVMHRTVDSARGKKIAGMSHVPFDRETCPYPFGINLAGYFRLESGLGQSCRLIAKTIEAAGIPHAFIDIDPAGIGGKDASYEKELGKTYPYSINLLSVNMGDLPRFLKMEGDGMLGGHYNIAFWLWELAEFPREWVDYCTLFDEIWTPSEFVSEAVRRVTDKKVFTIPYPVEAPYEKNLGRAHFNLPDDRFLVLTMYDFYSVSERKNPHGAIRAFKEAFQPGEKVGLVIKINHPDPASQQALLSELSGYKVYFVEGLRPKEEVNALLQCVDVFVSLHRGEGFGLVLAEAMLLGTVTVATNYSANTEFQDQNSACLVDYTLVPIEKEYWPYRKGALWADPDLHAASQMLRRLFCDQAYYESVQKSGIAYAKAKLSLERAKGLLLDRVSAIVPGAPLMGE